MKNSKELESFLASVFSWEDKPNKQQIELCEMAWRSCKRNTLKILDKYNAVSATRYIKEEIEKL